MLLLSTMLLLLHSIRQFFHNLHDPRLYVSVSGGSDSVALLHLIHQAKVPNVQAVVHMDHRQRGLESQKDCEFVQELCNTLGYPCQVHVWKGNMTFTQNAAREWRRACYQKCNNDGYIVTAHHQDDSYETMLLKLLRGTHISNIQGIQPIQTIENVTYVRPLLNYSKASLVEYLESQNLTWREDASNQSPKYQRNRIRNELIPLMNELAGGALDKRLDALASQSSLLRQDLDERVTPIVKSRAYGDTFNIQDLTLDLVGQETLHRWISGRYPGFTYMQLERVIEQLENFATSRKWQLDIGEMYTIERNGDILQLRGEVGENKLACTEENVAWSISDQSNKENVNESHLLIKLPVVSDTTHFIRTTLGERTLRFQPPWRQSPMKIKEFLRGQKVPLHRREVAPIILQNNQVVAVYVETNSEWVVAAEFSDSAENEHKIGISLKI